MNPSDTLPESLQTERLHIRVARPGDGPAFNAAVLASLPDLAPWLGWVTPPPTLEQSETNCRKAYARFLLNEDLMAFFFLRQGGALVGGSGLHKADWIARRFEVGYWCRSGFGGRGLITEGVCALADHALQVLRAHRVFLTVDERNRRSWRLAERAGFRLEGTLVNERLDLQGRPRDTRVYARTPDAADGGARVALPSVSPAASSSAIPAARGTEASPALPRVGVAVLVVRQGRVLIGRRKGAHGEGTWALPGGHLAFGESLEDGARRELLEETGLHALALQPGPCTSDVFEREGRHFVTVFVVATTDEAEARVCEPDKCDGWQWCDWSALPTPLFQPLHSLWSSGYRPPGAG